ncbi:MAG: replication restart helicase PriA, partial [Christensenellales bacterium]
MYAKVIVDIAHSGVDRLFEYNIPNGMALNIGYRVMVPFGKSNTLREGYILSLSEKCEYDSGDIKNISSVISDFPTLTAGQIRLAYTLRRYYHTTLATALRMMFPAEMRGGRVKDKFENEIVYSLTEEEYLAAVEALKTRSGQIKAPRQLEVLRTMRKYKRLKTNMLESLLPKSAAARDALVGKGLLVVRQTEVLRSPGKASKVEQDFKLTPEQNGAVQTITASKGKYLLHGVTGSGKTEVYIQIVQHCLSRGQTAIVLVPEISLTPQLVAMFERRMGEDIAVYHSTLTAGERYDEWKRMILGKAKVVIGARSAVFAPLKDIGVIIIDEEHETSYKSDMHPRYSAHEVARMRVNIEGATLVIASATPSVESYIKAINGIYKLVVMPNRLFGLKLPRIEIADMRQEIIRGNRTIFSYLLYNEIKDALFNGKQIILFINRRGYATFVMCRGCGFVEYCDSCAVTMTYHSSYNTMMCHYCGRKRKIRDVCPKCGKKYLKQFGIGTQRVQEHLMQCFPNARVLRMDLDTTRKKGAHLKIYQKFKDGDADILIGTQMIAKGLDFENVALVGVISADSSLFIPDYRSPEKTFQLIEQVSGRAGRKDPGKVVVQTYCPDHYAIAYAKAHDYEGFFNKEMSVRKSALLPPYSVFFRIVFTGRNEGSVKAACLDYGNGLKKAYAEMMKHVLLFDISEAPVRKIKG